MNGISAWVIVMVFGIVYHELVHLLASAYYNKTHSIIAFRLKGWKGLINFGVAVGTKEFDNPKQRIVTSLAPFVLVPVGIIIYSVSSPVGLVMIFGGVATISDVWALAAGTQDPGDMVYWTLWEKGKST